MNKLGIINYVPNPHDHEKCQICVQAKITRQSHKSVERSTEILNLIHSDVCDMCEELSIGGNKYFLTFIDDYSRYAYVYLLKTKDEVFAKFMLYKAEVENIH